MLKICCLRELKNNNNNKLVMGIMKIYGSLLSGVAMIEDSRQNRGDPSRKSKKHKM